MPGFDRTGPREMGPMTGRRMGPCNPSSQGNYSYGEYGPPYDYPYCYGRPRWGMRFGGRGRGGRGFGYGYPYYRDK